MAVDLNKLDAKQLRQVMVNARRLGNEEAYRKAFARLCAVLPGAEDTEGSADPLVQRFWQAVHAAEQIRTEVNGRTTRLSRTRQKVARVGIIETMSSVVVKSEPSAGFFILKDGGLPEFLFESVIREFPDRFPSDVRGAAETRLKDYAL
jgi:hypothetical protein